MAEAKSVEQMDVEQIVSLKKDLEDRDSARNESYDEVLKFYGGSSYRDIKKQGFIGGIVGAISSIFTAPAEEEDSELTTPINLVKPAIENKVAFLALQPTIRVIEPPAEFAPGAGGTTAAPAAPTPSSPGAPAPVEPEEWSTQFADRLERVISTITSQSNMPQRCRDVAWSMCAMDGAVIGVWPDLRHGRPRIFTRTPQDFFPVSYDPDGLELKQAVWVETVSGKDAVARFGADPDTYGDVDEVEIIQAIDEGFFYTVIDGKEFVHEPMENLAGVVPIVCVGALGLPGMIFGSTDIKDAIPVAKQINYHMALVDEMAGALVRPTIAIKDPMNVPPDIAIGRGGTITMGPNGNVELLGPLNLPNAFWQLSQQLQQWFDLISDNPAVLRSDEGGGLTTGKGFNAKLGPIAARMQTRLEILMSAWRQVLKYALIMWANFPGMKEVTASGIKGKEPFYLKAEPSEFMIEGEIWTEMDVFLSAQSYIDRQGNAVEIMQLYQNELIDWDTAVENLSQVTDKKRVRGKIDRDRQWKAEGLAMANQMANSGATANPSLMDQQYANYGLERGMMGEMPPPAQAEGRPPEEPANMAPPMAEMGGDTGGNIVNILKEFFASIAKLRGGVWFGGDPILNPEKIATDNWTVDVWITDPQDQGTITRAAENVEVIYGHIRFHRGQPDPDEQAIQVSSGAPPEQQPPPPVEEEEAEPEMPGEELDIESLLGGGM